MKTLAAAWGTVAALVLFLGSARASEASLQDTLLENQVSLGKSVDPALFVGAPIFLFSVTGSKEFVRRDFFSQFITILLGKNGVIVRKYSGDFESDYFRGKLDWNSLLAPKLLFQIAISPEKTGAHYTLDYRVSYLIYEQVSPGIIRCRVRFTAPREIKNIPSHEVEDALIGFIEKDILSLIKAQKGVLRPMPAGPKVENQKDSYRLKWLDPDNKRNHFYAGVTLGTPALVNANLGFWGSRGFPLVAGLSGMYYTAERRGIQFDLGWAFDNVGSFKQVAGLAFLGVNATSNSTSFQYDELGRISSTTIETIHRIAPYLGPVYTFDWLNWRFQSGVAFKTDSSFGASTLFLIQLGYTPSLNF